MPVLKSHNTSAAGLGKSQDSPNSTPMSQMEGNPSLQNVLQPQKRELSSPSSRLNYNSENELHEQNLLSQLVVLGVITVDDGHFPWTRV